MLELLELSELFKFFDDRLLFLRLEFRAGVAAVDVLSFSRFVL